MADADHPQEKIVETFDYNGTKINLVEWLQTVWCGKIGYADNNADEPDVRKIMDGFMALSNRNISANDRKEKDWDICMSLNYLSYQRPNGVMFSFLVGTDQQPEGFDVIKIPPAKFMRVRLCDETAKALGVEPWHGGIPPYRWIGEYAAPKYGYKYGDDALPVYEYYGFYSPETNTHKFGYLYVPVEKNT